MPLGVFISCDPSDPNPYPKAHRKRGSARESAGQRRIARDPQIKDAPYLIGKPPQTSEPLCVNSLSLTLYEVLLLMRYYPTTMPSSILSLFTTIPLTSELNALIEV